MVALAKHLDERINLRTSTEEKSLLRSACELEGFRDLTTFIITTMRRESLRILTEHNAQYLSDRDRDLVFEALQNPPEPNERLKKLMQKKKKS